MRLEHQPDPAFDQLLGVLPKSWHLRRVSSPEDGSSSIRSLRETRPGSGASSFQPDPSHTVSHGRSSYSNGRPRGCNPRAPSTYDVRRGGPATFTAASDADLDMTSVPLGSGIRYRANPGSMCSRRRETRARSARRDRSDD